MSKFSNKEMYVSMHTYCLKASVRCNWVAEACMDDSKIVKNSITKLTTRLNRLNNVSDDDDQISPRQSKVFVLGTIQLHEWFGEEAFILDTLYYEYTVTTRTFTRALQISRDDFLKSIPKELKTKLSTKCKNKMAQINNVKEHLAHGRLQSYNRNYQTVQSGNSPSPQANKQQMGSRPDSANGEQEFTYKDIGLKTPRIYAHQKTGGFTPETVKNNSPPPQLNVIDFFSTTDMFFTRPKKTPEHSTRDHFYKSSPMLRGSPTRVGSTPSVYRDKFMVTPMHSTRNLMTQTAQSFKVSRTPLHVQTRKASMDDGDEDPEFRIEDSPYFTTLKSKMKRTPVATMKIKKSELYDEYKKRIAKSSTFRKQSLMQETPSYMFDLMLQGKLTQVLNEIKTPIGSTYNQIAKTFSVLQKHAKYEQIDPHNPLKKEVIKGELPSKLMNLTSV